MLRRKSVQIQKEPLFFSLDIIISLFVKRILPIRGIWQTISQFGDKVLCEGKFLMLV